MNDLITQIAQELNIKAKNVVSVIQLLEGGATIPFMARYRKEVTGGLDEVTLTTIRDRRHQLKELKERRQSILDSLMERNLLTEELQKKIVCALTMTVLEDIYLPYRPKRRTRATIAKEKGLEPLAKLLFSQEDHWDPLTEARKYIDPAKQIAGAEEALAGARDIMAEWMNEDAVARASMRHLFETKAVFTANVIPGKEQEGIKYKDYFDWQESAKSIPSHRLLGVRRGEKESVLTLRVLPKEAEAMDILAELFIQRKNRSSEQVQLAVRDCYKRLLSLAMETEIRLLTKKRADDEAVKIFASNLRQLLMAPPLGQQRVMAIDPGIRTGSKLVCLDEQGQLLADATVYLQHSAEETRKAERLIRDYCDRYKVKVIAIGHGTGSRETESFVRGLKIPESIKIILASETGASIYSASDVAREEFPDKDVTVRGAISIGRRLMDPLAELVKIEPKSIGVGQYQHDVDQSLLKNALDDVVISCVNQVGVEVNTASKQLMTYVSGIGPVLAKHIIDYRNDHGPFRSRQGLLSVSGLGPKAFEQAAGFLRIRDAENPLDASAVHPESYFIVEQMARDLKSSIPDLIRDEQQRSLIKPENYLTGSIGLPTLNDILKELSKPGRDPREPFQIFTYQEGINSLQDLKSGMKLPGVVTNITAFGAFVDIGVHQDGLIHISQMSDRFVKDPREVVSIHQKVMVTVLEIDKERQRVALSLRQHFPLKRC